MSERNMRCAIWEKGKLDTALCDMQQRRLVQKLNSQIAISDRAHSSQVLIVRRRQGFEGGTQRKFGTEASKYLW
jgi:hypothetical protein